MSKARTEPKKDKLSREEVRQFLVDRDENDLRWMMSDKRGRRVMWKLLVKAGVYQQSYAGDNNATNFNEGRRSIGNYWLSQVHEICPEQYYQMVIESQEDQELENG